MKNIVQLLMTLEEEFSISILDAKGDEEQFPTVISVINYIKNKTDKERS